MHISDLQVSNKDRQSILVGESLQIRARVHLSAVDPQHVRVETYHGEIDNGDIGNFAATVLNQSSRPDDNGNYIYQGQRSLDRKRHLRFQRARRAHAPLPDASARTASEHLVIVAREIFWEHGLAACSRRQLCR